MPDRLGSSRSTGWPPAVTTSDTIQRLRTPDALQRAYPSSDVARYRSRPAWTLAVEDGRLVFSGGADEVYVADEVDDATVRCMQEQWDAGALDPDSIPADGRLLVQQLLAAGVLDGLPAGERSFRVLWAGEELPDLEARLQEFAARRGMIVGPGAVFTLVVRSGGPLLDLAGLDLPGPHLLADVAYHHTLSLGPLVVPPDTSCLGCLAGRIASSWGDPPTPARPAVCDEPELVASLAVREVEAIHAGSLALANRTVAYDLRGHELLSSSLLKLPWCPRCGDAAPVHR